MGEADIQVIREDIGEVKEGLREVVRAVADLRVVVAGEYVRKDDFLKCQECAETRIVALHQKIEKHMEDEKADRWKLAGIVVTVSSLIFTGIQWMVSLLKGGGNH